jgi:hypothetical protein
MMGRIRKTYGPLSSGTRCEVVSTNHTNEIDPERNMLIRVGPFSKAFYNQNHDLVREIKAEDGLIGIPAEYVQVLDA